MPFNKATGRYELTKPQERRLASAVRAYNAAITRRSKELVDMGIEVAYALPARLTTREVAARINSAQDFRRIVGYANDVRRGRSSELTRILKSVNPDALELVRDSDGAVTTRYQQREKKYNRIAEKRAARKARRQMAVEMFKGDVAIDIDALSDPARAVLYDGTAMMDDTEGEWDDSYEDVDAQTKANWEFEDSRARRSAVEPHSMYQVYRDVWVNPANQHIQRPGYNALLDALDWLAVHRIDILNKMFNSGRDEIDVPYIVISGANNPYNSIPFDTRHERAVKFITGVAVDAGMGTDGLVKKQPMRYEKTFEITVKE